MSDHRISVTGRRTFPLLLKHLPHTPRATSSQQEIV